MKAAKTINNDVIGTCDEEDREVIVMGRGVGFKAEEGSTVDEEKVERISRLENQNTMDRSKELLVNLPMEHIQISTEIISYARKVLNRPINPNVYITFTGHIGSALKRCRQKTMFSGPLIREVYSFYHMEYLIGEYTIAMIERGLGARLPVDEVASIAPHIVNTEYDMPMGGTIKIIDLIQQVLEVVREYFSIELDGQPLNYERFAVHLRFLAQRVFTGEHTNLNNPEFQEVIDRLYPEEYACNQKMQALIKLQYRHWVAEEGVAYLALHIKRIRTK